MSTRILILFVDGVGVGSNDRDSNPFMRAHMPAFEHLRAAGTFVPVDAALGVAGLPQSGTGQTALFTGINAAQEFGRHFGPWVPTALRERLARENILMKAKSAGKTIAFANAYPEELFAENVDARKARDPLRAGPPIVAIGAGVLNRHTAHLMRGDAVASEITNDGWRKHLGRTGLPIISAADAGKNLARISAAHDVTLFAHYSTDYVGHDGGMAEAVEALEKVDEFLGGVAAAVLDDTLVAVVSDHGNIEDVTAGHTYNPAVGLFFGRKHERCGSITTLTDVTPLLLSILADSH